MRHPAATDFRAAWDAAIAGGWRRIDETALERAINGVTETITRDGKIETRRRPCSAKLMIRMLDRAATHRAAAAAPQRS